MDAGKLRAYYEDAYAAIREHAPECFVVISPRNWEQDGAEWQNYMAAASYTKVLQDLHRCALCCSVRLSADTIALWPRVFSVSAEATSAAAPKIQWQMLRVPILPVWCKPLLWKQR